MKSTSRLLQRLLNPFGFKFKNEFEDSIQKIVTINAVDRRKNVRINYPEVGAVGGLPVVKFDEKQIEVQNISIGGLCLLDKQDLLGDKIGQEVDLHLIWPDRVAVVRSQIVGTNLASRHIQFVNLPPEILVRLNMLLKPGFTGTKYRRVENQDSNLQLECDELWLSPTGDSCALFVSSSKTKPVALLNLGGQKFKVFSAPAFRVVKEIDSDQWEEVSKKDLSEILVCLANFFKPTDILKQLLIDLNEVYKQ